MVYAHYQDLTSIPQNRMDPRNEICRLWDLLEESSSVSRKNVRDLYCDATNTLTQRIDGIKENIRFEGPPRRSINGV